MVVAFTAGSVVGTVTASTGEEEPFATSALDEPYFIKLPCSKHFISSLAIER